MTRINGNNPYKAADTATTESSSATEAALVSQIDEALEALDQIDDGDLTDEYFQEKKRLTAMLKAEKAMLESGDYVNGASGTTTAEDVIPQDLEAGWNCIPPEGFSENASDRAVINGDKSRYGEYAGTVEIPNSGSSTDPNTVGFQMTDDMKAVYAETRGRDIILIVEYTNGKRESWVVKEGTVRPEPIIISAFGLSHGVTIDCSKVYRVSDGTSSSTSAVSHMMFIQGSEHDDTLIGSQSKDLIVGWAGDDTIDAMAGDDIVFGDEQYRVDEYRSGSFDASYGGNDTIRGGAGDDILYGQGGLDTSASSDVGETVAEFERAPLDDTLAEPPDADDFIDATGWDAEEEDGTIVLTNSSEEGVGGEIDIDMPEGYTMAHAEADADGSLVITFIGEDEEGNTVSFKVKIADFFTFAEGSQNPESVIRLNMHGGEGDDIIDFSRISGSAGLTTQVINITDTEGGANILLGAKSALLSEGLDLGDLTESQGVSDSALEGIVDDGVFAGLEEDESNGYTADVVNGAIEITKDGSEADPTVTIAAPEGYDRGYITEDNDYYYVILAKTGADGKADTIVYRIEKEMMTSDGTALGWEDIIVKRSTDDDIGDSFISLVPVTNASSNDSDFAMSGGDDNDDLVFAQAGTRTEDDESEIVPMMATITEAEKESEDDSDVNNDDVSNDDDVNNDDDVGNNDETNNDENGDEDDGE